MSTAFTLHDTASIVDIIYSLSVGWMFHCLHESALLNTIWHKSANYSQLDKAKICKTIDQYKRETAFGSHPLDTNMVNEDFIRGIRSASNKEMLIPELETYDPSRSELLV